VHAHAPGAEGEGVLFPGRQELLKVRLVEKAGGDPLLLVLVLARAGVGGDSAGGALGSGRMAACGWRAVDGGNVIKELILLHHDGLQADKKVDILFLDCAVIDARGLIWDRLEREVAAELVAELVVVPRFRLGRQRV